MHYTKGQYVIPCPQLLEFMGLGAKRIEIELALPTTILSNLLAELCFPSPLPPLALLNWRSCFLDRGRGKS